MPEKKKRKKCYPLSFLILGGRNLTRALQSSPFQISGGVVRAWRRRTKKKEILASNFGWQWSAVKCSAIPLDAVQQSKVQYSTLQCSAEFLKRTYTQTHVRAKFSRICAKFRLWKATLAKYFGYNLTNIKKIYIYIYVSMAIFVQKYIKEDSDRAK